MVVHAGGRGEAFVPDMGDSARLLDLGRDMVRPSGFEASVDIPIRIVGMRPGDKAAETLAGDGETVGPTNHLETLRLRCLAVVRRHSLG